MPKIKLSGHQELVKVSQKQALELKELWMDKNVPDSEKLDVGTIVFTKSQIKAVFLDEQLNELGLKYKKQIEDYYVWRDNLLALPPRQRAEQCTAWGMFTLFFRGVYGNQPKEIVWKEKVLQATTEWFENNPEWAKPSFVVFQKMLQLKDDTPMNETCMKLLLRTQQSEVQDIEQTKQYIAGKLKKEQLVQNMVDEISVEELFNDPETKTD